jgi:hypothetical protein
MRRTLAIALGCLVIVGAVIAFAVTRGRPSTAQPTSASAAQKYDPKDLTGMWRKVEGPYTSDATYDAFIRSFAAEGDKLPARGMKSDEDGLNELPIQYTPEFEKIHQKFRADYVAGKPYRIGLHCMTAGMFQMMVRIPTLEIFHMSNPDRYIFKAFLVAQEYRVFTDAKHPTEYLVTPELYGHSIGKWEGNTYVVDTENMGMHAVIGETEPISRSFHVVQRISRPAYDTLVIDFFAEDKRAWLKPMQLRQVYKLNPEFEMAEAQCQDDGWGGRTMALAPE